MPNRRCSGAIADVFISYPRSSEREVCENNRCFFAWVALMRIPGYSMLQPRGEALVGLNVDIKIRIYIPISYPVDGRLGLNRTIQQNLPLEQVRALENVACRWIESKTKNSFCRNMHS